MCVCSCLSVCLSRCVADDSGRDTVQKMKSGPASHQKAFPRPHHHEKVSKTNTRGGYVEPTAQRAPLIYAATNRNRDGWLMPDESIPE